MRKLMLASAAVATLISGTAGMAQPRQGGPGGGAYQGPQGAPQAAAPTQPTGSFSQSCRNVQVQGSNVTAECRNIHSQYPKSTINFTACRGDLSNQNGVLTCPGATASVPAGQDDGSGERRNNNGQVAAGVAAGALLGALGANAYNNQQQPPYQQQQPPPPPPQGPQGPPNFDNHPNWGDQHYGDPRFDPRYGAGGWGYGHRSGEWVSIRERDVWLGRRIDRAVYAGYLGRREQRDLQRDMQGLEALEYRYMQQGLAPWMRADLDRRFDGLVDRVGDSAPPPPPRDDYRNAPPPPPPGNDGNYYGH